MFCNKQIEQICDYVHTHVTDWICLYSTRIELLGETQYT